ncbi:phosphotransferase [Patescibacteria group bacterium]|nr:phosphotransferase [Patescibacteria group bacterium]
MPDSELDSILCEAGKELSLINSVVFEGFGSIYKNKDFIVNKLQGNSTTYKDFILMRAEKNIDILCASGYFNSNQILTIKKVLQSNKIMQYVLDITQGYLTHGDYHLDHIFHYKGKYVGIIDFGDAKIASQGYDLAYFKIRNRNLFEKLCYGYNQTKNFSIRTTDNSIIVFLVGIRVLASAFENNQIIGDKDERYLSFKDELERIDEFI